MQVLEPWSLPEGKEMSSPLVIAEVALEKGDYRQCIAILEPLTKDYPLKTKDGARVRMIMITAWMGQGEEKKAIAACREIIHCNDDSLRQNAKQLLEILEAPALSRPSNWSVSIPQLNIDSSNEKNFYKSLKKSEKRILNPYNNPPTGDTKGFNTGFLTFILLILTILTFFLN